MFRAILAACLVAAAVPARATWLPDEFDLVAILPPPPGDGDPATRADLAEVLRRQAARTPAEVARARADVDESVFVVADVFGTLRARDLPETADLFARAVEDMDRAVNRAKNAYDRHRPPEVDASVRPCLPVPATCSYPGGHAALGMLFAILLGDMAPERRAALFERGRAFAENRVNCGIHFPGDTEAGYLAAAAVASRLLADPGFLARFAVARTELRRAVGLPDALPPVTAAPEAAPEGEDFRVRR